MDEQFYIEYYKEYERNRYLAALDRKNKVLSIEVFDSEDDNGVDFIVDEDEDVERQVTDKLMIEKLRSVLPLLSDDERELIDAIYFRGCSERDYAREKGIYHNAVHKKKQRILEKLKNFLES